MSFHRRLTAVALPAAGVTVLAAALALTGQPASAAGAQTRSVSTMVLPATQRTECDALAMINIANQACDPAATGGSRSHRGYGDDDAGEGPDGGYDDGTDGNGTGGDDGADGPGGEGPVRGNDGYGGDNETPPGSETPPGGGTPPGGSEVPPGGEGPGELPPGGEGPGEVPPGGGVSPGEIPIPGRGGAGGVRDTLPVTGSPVVVLGVIGVLLTVGGAAVRLAVRRRRA